MLSCSYSLSVPSSSDHLFLWDTTCGTKWKKHDKSKGFCSGLVKLIWKSDVGGAVEHNLDKIIWQWVSRCRS